MSKKSQRELKVPDLFNLFAKRAAEELEAEEEEGEVPQRRQARRRRRRHDIEDGEEEQEPAAAAPAAAAGQADATQDDDSDAEEEEEQEEQHASDAQSSSGKRARTAVATPFVPQPPPRSSSDMHSLLFACPALIDALLEPDGLRTISLVARDAASLAWALCACTADVAGLWHQLARRCDPAFATGGTTAEALAVVRRACKADPARAKRLDRRVALKDYCLRDRDLWGVHYTVREDPYVWNAPSVIQYNKLAVLTVARRKHGSAAGLQAARLAAHGKTLKARAARGKAKAARDQTAGQRRESVYAALEDAGLCELDCQRCLKDQSVRAFIKHGTGTAAGVAAALKEQEEEGELRQQRTWQLQLRLVQAGLGSKTHWAAAQAYIAAGEQRMSAVVAAVRVEHAAAAVKLQRRQHLYKLFGKEMLYDTDYTVQPYQRVAGLDEYLESGEGSEAAVLAAARAVEVARRARIERGARMRKVMEEEGLSNHLLSSAVQAYIDSGKGCEDDVLQPLRYEQLAERGLLLRSMRMRELLEAEGLQRYQYEAAVHWYIRKGAGSEEAAMAAAREAAEEAQRCDERRARLTQLLAAEGISLGAVQMDARALVQYVCLGNGTEQDALESARQVQHMHRQRRQRRDVLTQLLAAEGMSLPDWQDKVEGMVAYLQHGRGSPTELAAQARAQRDARGPALAAYAV